MVDSAIVSVMSSVMIWIWIGFFAGIIWLCIKIKDIKSERERKSLYESARQEKCDEPDSQHLKLIFTISANEILKGEKVVSSSGKQIKKISSIKDAPARLAAQNNGDLSFQLDKRDGTVYKVLKLRGSDAKYYYKIDFAELNKFLEMNSSAYDRYKTINAENWRNLC